MMQIPPPSPDHLNLDQKQRPSLLEGHSSSLPIRLQVLQPQNHHHHQQQEEQLLETPKKMPRRKSPSQKIPRNHTHSARAIPSHSNRCETDENGDPKIMIGPLTCFSYRTYEKQYEKDTQRMLERIQKSRSFEHQKQQRQQEGTSRTNEDGSAQRSVSLKDLSSIENDAFSRNLYYDSGFYIGDEGYDHHDHDYDNSYIVPDHDHYYQEQQDFENGTQYFEEQEEIFELDL